MFDSLTDAELAEDIDACLYKMLVTTDTGTKKWWETKLKELERERDSRSRRNELVHPARYYKDWLYRELDVYGKHYEKKIASTDDPAWIDRYTAVLNNIKNEKLRRRLAASKEVTTPETPHREWASVCQAFVHTFTQRERDGGTTVFRETTTVGNASVTREILFTPDSSREKAETVEISKLYSPVSTLVLCDLTSWRAKAKRLMADDNYRFAYPKLAAALSWSNTILRWDEGANNYLLSLSSLYADSELNRLQNKIHFIQWRHDVLSNQYTIVFDKSRLLAVMLEIISK